DIDSSVADSFEALNASLSPSCSVLKIADKTILDHPLEVLFLTLAKEPQSVSGSHVEIHIGSSCSLALLERHHQQDACEAFVNVKVQVHLGSQSKLEYVQIQEQNFKSFHY